MNIRKQESDEDKFVDLYHRTKNKIDDINRKKDLLDEKIDNYNDQLQKIIYDHIKSNFKSKNLILKLTITNDIIKINTSIPFDDGLESYTKYSNYYLESIISIRYYPSKTLTRITETINNMIIILNSIKSEQVHCEISNTTRKELPYIEIYLNLEESEDD